VTTRFDPMPGQGRVGAGARKGYVDGTHRLIPPAETLERVVPLLPVFGITRIANITGLDVIGLPVVMVCRPNARSLSVSQGKGTTLASAKASGIMEAIEAYHAEHITLPLRFATYNELRSIAPVIDPRQLPRFALSPFHDHLRILWIEGVDLLHGARTWVPYEMVHLDYTLPLPPGSGCFATSSSGLASGNHLLEAINHGICEVVERDAMTLWRATDEPARSATRMDLSTVDDPVCRDALERLSRAGMDAVVWETTSDAKIPAFSCAIFERSPGSWHTSHVSAGSGCHPTRGVALARALTEAAQSRLTMIAGSRDDNGRAEYLRAADPMNSEPLRQRLAAQTPRRHFHEAPTFASDTFEADADWLLDRLRSIGCPSVVVVELTKPGLDLNVVRVIVPGLEPAHDLPGYAPGPRAMRRARL
jgi:ribosomal protein S12 methylthiotransferase accessory factor